MCGTGRGGGGPINFSPFPQEIIYGTWLKKNIKGTDIHDSVKFGAC